jgi:hypothetical protein
MRRVLQFHALEHLDPLPVSPGKTVSMKINPYSFIVILIRPESNLIRVGSHDRARRFLQFDGFEHLDPLPVSSGKLLNENKALFI